MSEVTLSWTNPTPATDQRPVKGTNVYVRVKGATDFDLLAFVSANDPSHLIDGDVADGDWEYQATTIDSADKESAPSPIAAITVTSAPPAIRDPSPPVGFTATQTA